MSPHNTFAEMPKTSPSTIVFPDTPLPPPEKQATIVGSRKMLFYLKKCTPYPNKANNPAVEWFYPELLSGEPAEPESVVDNSPRYRKQWDVVYVEGFVTNTVLGDAIFILPESFRPERPMRFVTPQTSPGVGYPNLTCRIMVREDGRVYIEKADEIERLEKGSVELSFCFTVAE